MTLGGENRKDCSPACKLPGRLAGSVLLVTLAALGQSGNQGGGPGPPARRDPHKRARRHVQQRARKQTQA